MLTLWDDSQARLLLPHFLSFGWFAQEDPRFQAGPEEFIHHMVCSLSLLARCLFALLSG